MAAGGRVVYGTDLGNQGPPPGIDVAELQLMVGAGMTPEQALLAATAGAAAHLRLAGTGRLTPGARADLVAVRGDPLRDLRTLARVRLVSRDAATSRPAGSPRLAAPHRPQGRGTRGGGGAGRSPGDGPAAGGRWGRVGTTAA